MTRTALAVKILLLACIVGFAEQTAAPARPNVMLIAVDDLNDWIGCMGGAAKTPNMGRQDAAEIVARLKPGLPRWTARMVFKYEGGARVTETPQ